MGMERITVSLEVATQVCYELDINIVFAGQGFDLFIIISSLADLAKYNTRLHKVNSTFNTITKG